MGKMGQKELKKELCDDRFSGSIVYDRTINSSSIEKYYLSIQEQIIC